jgi:hypothetical protein
MIPDLPPWATTPPPARCPDCLRVPLPGDSHSRVMAHDAFGQPIVFCYDDEGESLPAEEEHTPAPDPWLDPDAAAAHYGLPF